MAATPPAGIGEITDAFQRSLADPEPDPIRRDPT